jgi:hypothetical protein
MTIRDSVGQNEKHERGINGMQLNPDPALDRLFRIFFPNAYNRQLAFLMSGKRLAHYTSAEAAMSILRNKEVWMRKTSCMNDFSEVQHGLDCLIEAYKGEHGKGFRAALDGIFDGITAEIEQHFNGWIPHFKNDTYIACFSEHQNEEDYFGRLSMWRAYSDMTGVAFVMNTAPFFKPSQALKAYTSPVAYLIDKNFEAEFQLVLDNIVREQDFIETQDRKTITSIVFLAFKFAALCTKHLGFEEEKEWRIVYSPSMEKSPHLIKDVKVIKGIPQPIYKVPLQDIPDEGLTGIEIPFLLDRIIIGPSEYPLVMHEAFCDLLLDAGVKEPQEKVFISYIPLRR